MTPQEDIPFQFQFKCAECGKLFEANPDTMVELTWTPEIATEEEIEQMEEAGIGISADQLADLDEGQLAEMEITPEIRDQMLRGEEVSFGGLCICIECQDRLAKEQHQNE